MALDRKGCFGLQLDHAGRLVRLRSVDGNVAVGSRSDHVKLEVEADWPDAIRLFASESADRSTPRHDGCRPVCVYDCRRPFKLVHVKRNFDDRAIFAQSKFNVHISRRGEYQRRAGKLLTTDVFLKFEVDDDRAAVSARPKVQSSGTKSAVVHRNNAGYGAVNDDAWFKIGSNCRTICSLFALLAFSSRDAQSTVGCGHRFLSAGHVFQLEIAQPGHHLSSTTKGGAGQFATQCPAADVAYQSAENPFKAMSVQALVFSSGLSFLFLCLVFRPLELAFPARRGQQFFRPSWWTDLCFFLGQYLVWGGLVVALLNLGRGWIDGALPPTFRAAVASQPWWSQAIEVVLLSDFCVYWGHRWQHRVSFLWRFHSIHHSAEHLDWLAAHREHPVDTIYTMGLINLPAFVLGFPLETLAGLIAFRGIWAIYIHSNVRLPIGPMRVLIGAPELHHWHHERDRDAGNYANISPLMDVLFGTYRCPDHEPQQVGLREPIARSYVGQLLHPFRRSTSQAPAPAVDEAAGVLDNCKCPHQLYEPSCSVASPV